MYLDFWGAVTTLGGPVLWAGIVLSLTALCIAMERGLIRYRNSKKHSRRLKKFLLLIIPALALSLLGSEVLKLIFQVPRPCIPCPAPGCNPYCLNSFSFPSGHTATMAGIATAVALLGRKRRYLLVYAAPVLVGASRVALDVHTMTDVVGGFVVGIVLTVLVWKYRKRIYRWEDEIL